MRVGPGQRVQLDHLMIAFANETAHALDVEFENGGMRVRPAIESLNAFWRQPDPQPITVEELRRAREQYEAMHERMRREPQYIVHPNMLDELRQVLGENIGSRQADTFDTAAIDRARSLLRRNLTTQQRKSFDRYGSFVVIGNQSHAHYTIKNTGRVIRQTDQHEFCLQVVGEPVPVEDAMLARKCLIESNEELFLSTANDLSERGLEAGQPDAGYWHQPGQQRELERQCRLAEREAWHRAQQALATPPEIPDPSFTDRLRALYERHRG